MAPHRALLAARSGASALTRQQYRCYSAPGDRVIPAAKQKYIPSSGTYPKGFLAGSAFAGVKASNTKYDDLALVVSEQPCAAGAVFTRNLFKAAPVQTSYKTLQLRKNEGIRGVVVNSGCANAVTGSQGLKDATQMAAQADDMFGEGNASSADSTPRTLVMSTGVIGQNLPMDRISPAIPKLQSALGSSHDHWLNTAKAICTTDTFPKLISRTFKLPSSDIEYSIAGMTKGAGMIHPNMATLLGIICTDAKIAPNSITPLLSRANARSFNNISIDGDTSTNDTVVLLANGAAVPEDKATEVPAMVLDKKFMTEQDSKSAIETAYQDGQAFAKVLGSFMSELAQLVVRDGEGATKFVRIRVLSDHGYHAAQEVAKSIACSSLVKTALYGKDANWGRILCAVGYAAAVLPRENFQPSAAVRPESTSVSFVPTDGSAELKLLVRGEPEKVDEERAKVILEMEDLEIVVRLNDTAEKSSTGHEAVFWTCDFSHEYVTINGDYRT